MRHFAAATILLMLLASFQMWAGDLTPLSGAEAEKAVTTINSANSGIKTLQASFEQVRESSMLAEKMVSKGKMHYKEGKLRWEYETPYPSLFILSGEQVLTSNSQGTTKRDLRSSRAFKSVADVMMNGVTGMNMLDTSNFKVTVYSSDNGYVADLEPLKRDMKQMFKTIRLSFGADSRVSCIELLESSGKTTITLSGAKYNGAISDSVFSID